MDPRTTSDRASAERVMFKYGVQMGGRTEFAEIPFILAVLADLSGTPDADRSSKDLQFTQIRPGETITDLFLRFRPSLTVTVPDYLSDALHSEALQIRLTFRSLADFDPSAIAGQVPEIRDFIQREGAQETSRDSRSGPPARSPKELGQQLDAILHHAEFERLHAAWLGLDRLVRESSEVPAAGIAVLDLKKEDLYALPSPTPGERRISNQLQSVLYSLKTDSFGVHPPAALIADFVFAPQDTELLSDIAGLLESIGTVLIGSADPEFFPRDTHAFLNEIDKIVIHHRNMAFFERWRQFRRDPLSQHILLTVPQVLLRTPFEHAVLTPNAAGGCTFIYNESVSPLDGAGYLWGNGVFALGCLLTKSFARYGWVATLSPFDGQGMALEYACHHSTAPIPDLPVGPTCVAVWQYTSSTLAGMGFIALVACKGTPTLTVLDDHACCRSDNPMAHLVCSLAVGRFRHSFALFARQTNLSQMGNRDLEEELKRWLSEFLVPNSVDIAAKWSWPLNRFAIAITTANASRSAQLTLDMNYGAGRSATLQLEIVVPLQSFDKKFSDAELKGSLEATIGVAPGRRLQGASGG